MEFWLARAMQIACLEGQDLTRIHNVELRDGYPLSNGNIQEILKTQSVKQHLGIPDHQEGQANHAGRVGKEIVSKAMFENYPTVTNLDALHAFDWTILNRRDEIVWSYHGGNKSGGSLRKSMGE